MSEVVEALKAQLEAGAERERQAAERERQAAERERQLSAELSALRLGATGAAGVGAAVAAVSRAGFLATVGLNLAVPSPSYAPASMLQPALARERVCAAARAAEAAAAAGGEGGDATIALALNFESRAARDRAAAKLAAIMVQTGDEGRVRRVAEL